MPDQYQKPFAVCLCFTAFAWTLFTSYNFYLDIVDWKDLKIDGYEFTFEMLMLFVENVPTFIALLIAKNYLE